MRLENFQSNNANEYHVRVDIRGFWKQANHIQRVPINIVQGSITNFLKKGVRPGN